MLMIISAWEPELAMLRARLDGAKSVVARSVTTEIVGVGLVDAGIGTVRALARARKRPRAVVFVGTAGVYPGEPKGLVVGAAAVIRRMVLLSHAEVRRDSYFPPSLLNVTESNPRLRRALARAGSAPVVDTACPLGITATHRVARRAARSKRLQVENLEVFSAARAAANARVPFAAVLGIANETGPAAHRQWEENAAAASAAACDVVWDWLARRR